MKLSITVLAAICATAVAINTDGRNEYTNSISASKPSKSGTPTRGGRKYFYRRARDYVEEGPEIDVVSHNNEVNDHNADDTEDSIDENGKKWELKWDERIEQDRADAINDISRPPANVTDYSYRENKDASSLEFWTGKSKPYVTDLVERLSYLLVDLGVDINAAFCGELFYGDVILSQNPNYGLLVESITEFRKILDALNVDFIQEICTDIKRKRGDEVFNTGFWYPKLKTREDVEKYLKFMDEVLKKVGSFTDLDNKEN